MGPSGEARKAGLADLNEVTRLTKVSRQTLTNWYKNKPELFRVVILGCAADREKPAAAGLRKLQ
jgi:hypothetical protein